MHQWKIGQRYKWKRSSDRTYTKGKIYVVKEIAIEGSYKYPLMSTDKQNGTQVWHYPEKDYKEFLVYWQPVVLKPKNLPTWW